MTNVTIVSGVNSYKSYNKLLRRREFWDHFLIHSTLLENAKKV